MPDFGKAAARHQTHVTRANYRYPQTTNSRGESLKQTPILPESPVRLQPKRFELCLTPKSARTLKKRNLMRSRERPRQYAEPRYRMRPRAHRAYLKVAYRGRRLTATWMAPHPPEPAPKAQPRRYHPPASDPPR